MDRQNDYMKLLVANATFDGIPKFYLYINSVDYFGTIINAINFTAPFGLTIIAWNLFLLGKSKDKTSNTIIINDNS